MRLRANFSVGLSVKVAERVMAVAEEEGKTRSGVMRELIIIGLNEKNRRKRVALGLEPELEEDEPEDFN